MLFRMTEHYDIYNNDYYTSNDEICCFICYDKEYPHPPIKLNRNRYYLKKCNCNDYIHEVCLDKWVNLNMSCPYCRMEIQKKNSLLKNLFITTNSYISKIIIYYAINIIKIQGYIFFLFWAYFTFELYYKFIINKHINIYDKPYESYSYILNSSHIKPYLNLTN